MTTKSRMRSGNQLLLASGFSLIELLVALVLGTLVVLATTGIFISNKRSYNTTQSTSRIQENARSAFEMLSRELREAGANSCSKGIPTASLLLGPGGVPLPGWWSNWQVPLHGYANGAGPAGTSILAGTDAIAILSTVDEGRFVLAHAPATALMTLNTTAGLKPQDVLLACDYTQGAIFQATGVTPTTVSHLKAGLNCRQGLGMPQGCSDAVAGVAKEFAEGSRVSKLQASLWYVAENDRGGTSLYRKRMLEGAVGDEEEIAEGVTDMELTYLGPSGAGQAYQDTLANYADATAVRVHMTIQDTQVTGTENQPIVRQLMNVVSLRNRLP